MRFIVILLLVINGSVFAQNTGCKDDYFKKNYSYNQFEITECDCRCTIQENTFFIYNSESNSTIKLLGASKIMVNDSNIRDDEPVMKYFMSTKKFCIPDVVLEKKALNFLTLVPCSDGQPCYEYSAYIDSIGNLEILEGYIVAQIIETIIPKKQFLCNGPNKCSQTKMYLIKGDKVEILKEEEDWLYVLYKGKREIMKWIPKQAVE